MKKSIFLFVFILFASSMHAATNFTPTVIPVGINKTVHLLFDTPIRYVDLGSPNIIAAGADGAENVLRIKSAVASFEGETNFTVITDNGSFYTFLAVFSDDPVETFYRIGRGGEGSALLDNYSGADPSYVYGLMSKIYEQDRRDVKTIGTKATSLTASAKGIYSEGSLVYLHLELENRSSLDFNVEYIRFRVEDKKKVRRMASQNYQCEPLQTYKPLESVSAGQTSRSLVVFDNLAITKGKNLIIEIFEKGGSRNIQVVVKGESILKAGQFSMRG